MGIWYDKQAYELLKKCSDTKDLTGWNEYRKTTNYAPINLRFSNCSGFYLREADLQYVDFCFAQINDTDFSYADVSNVKIDTSAYLVLFFTFIFIFLPSIVAIFRFLDNSFNFLILFSISSITFSYFVYEKISWIRTILGTMIVALGFVGLFVILTILSVVISFGGLTFLNEIFNDLVKYQNFFGSLGLFCGWALSFSIGSVIYMSQLKKMEIENTDILSVALNPEKAIGVNLERLKSHIRYLSIEYTKQRIRLKKQHQYSEDTLKELEEKIIQNQEKEHYAYEQQERINNVVKQLEIPFAYVKELRDQINVHIKVFYIVIIVVIILLLIFPSTNFFTEKICIYNKLFEEKPVVIPSFGIIFGVLTSIFSPFVLGLSIIVYAVSQINKNLEKIIRLRGEERNIEQIISTLTAKAQIGISDEELIKETKNLIQKYQEGMMAGMFTKEKTEEKEDKSASLSYRDKLLVNGVSKLLMQALKK